MRDEGVSISLDDRDKVNTWRDFLQKSKMKGLQLKAEKGMESDIREWFEIRGIPSYVLIDKDGRLLNGHAPRPLSPYIHNLLNRYIGSEQ